MNTGPSVGPATSACSIRAANPILLHVGLITVFQALGNHENNFNSPDFSAWEGSVQNQIPAVLPGHTLPAITLCGLLCNDLGQHRPLPNQTLTYSYQEKYISHYQKEIYFKSIQVVPL